MQPNETNDFKLPLFDKILMKKIIFQQKIATDLIGKRSTRTGRDKHAISGINGDEAHKAC
jgi:hypothetical protein